MVSFLGVHPEISVIVDIDKDSNRWYIGSEDSVLFSALRLQLLLLVVNACLVVVFYYYSYYINIHSKLHSTRYMVYGATLHTTVSLSIRISGL